MQTTPNFFLPNTNLTSVYLHCHWPPLKTAPHYMFTSPYFNALFNSVTLNAHQILSVCGCKGFDGPAMGASEQTGNN